MQPNLINDSLETSFKELIDAIRVARNLRAIAGLKPSQEVPVRFVTDKLDLTEILNKSTMDIQVLTRASKVEIYDPQEIKAESSSKSLVGVSGDLEVILPIEGLVDVKALRARLHKDLSKAEKEITILANRLKNPSFTQKAPEKVVLECKAKLSDAESQAELVTQRLLGLN